MSGPCHRRHSRHLSSMSPMSITWPSTSVTRVRELTRDGPPRMMSVRSPGAPPPGRSVHPSWFHCLAPGALILDEDQRLGHRRLRRAIQHPAAHARQALHGHLHLGSGPGLRREQRLAPHSVRRADPQPHGRGGHVLELEALSLELPRAVAQHERSPLLSLQREGEALHRRSIRKMGGRLKVRAGAKGPRRAEEGQGGPRTGAARAVCQAGVGGRAPPCCVVRSDSRRARCPDFRTVLVASDGPTAPSSGGCAEAGANPGAHADDRQATGTSSRPGALQGLALPIAQRALTPRGLFSWLQRRPPCGAEPWLIRS